MNTLILIITLIFTLVEGSPNIINNDQWIRFKEQFNKNYGSPTEEWTRFGYFMDNLRQIEEHNAGSDSYRMGLNYYSDFNKSELNRFLETSPVKVGDKWQLENDYGFEIAEEARLRELIPEWSDDVPDQVDWRTRRDIIGEVKNQYECGSCWAFVTTGLLEGQQHKFNPKGQKVVPLSEEQLISCDTKNLGCRGGKPETAINYIKRVGGLETESDYPLTSVLKDSKNNCLFNISKIEERTRNIDLVIAPSSFDETLLKKVVAFYGPVIVKIYVPEKFKFYRTGIFRDRDCVDVESINHGVLLVGYGTTSRDEDYWIVKNSWSEDWGENGYAKIIRNARNHCCMGCISFIATFKK